MALQSINPATGATLATFDTLSPADVAAKARARIGSLSVLEARRRSTSARALLARAADILDARVRRSSGV